MGLRLRAFFGVYTKIIVLWVIFITLLIKFPIWTTGIFCLIVYAFDGVEAIREILNYQGFGPRRFHAWWKLGSDGQVIAKGQHISTEPISKKERATFIVRRLGGWLISPIRCFGLLIVYSVNGGPPII